MLPDETNKIKSLVNTSTILSASEKTEWLALLDVMNDKQLGELEGILVSSKQPAVSSKQAAPVTFNQPKAVTPPKPAVMQMPKLSHIMNLPNFTPTFAKTTAEPLPQPPLGAPQADAGKKPSAFASKLKAIFKEKELPAGLPELELEEGHKSQNTEHRTQNKQDQKIPPAAPKPIFTLKEQPLAKPQVVKPIPTPLKVLPPVPKPKNVSFGIFHDPVNPVNLKPVLAPKLSPAAAPKILKPELLNEPQMNSLQDLAVLEPGTLRATSLDGLTKKIKLLIGKYGYFEVIFNIEKSRLYKNYIGTGLKLLSGQTGFESLDRLDEDYLSKEEFEKFTDLLSKIQAS
jgi:hypothetical protein